MDNAPQIYSLIRTIRLSFNQLTALADQLHADMDMTAAQRMVLEQLSLVGPQTVPHMAKARGVTRQHMQTLVDGLLDRGLVTLQPNPAHKRSALVALTADGKRAFQDMRAREAVVLAELAGTLPQQDVAKAKSALEQLNAVMARHMAGDENT